MANYESHIHLSSLLNRHQNHLHRHHLHHHRAINQTNQIKLVQHLRRRGLQSINYSKINAPSYQT